MVVAHLGEAAVSLFFLPQSHRAHREKPFFTVPGVKDFLCVVCLSVAVFAACREASAQNRWRRGATEWGVLSGGGPAITGGVRDRGFWFLAGRWGRQLTSDRGDSWARGHLQYAVEAMPLYLHFQSDTVYGAGLTPFLLRYNFTRGRVVVPFLEAGAGILATTEQVPEGTSRFNFTPQAGVGLQYVPAARFGWTLGVRYHHTSNAGIARRNPGINAVVIHTGLSWWR